MDQRGQSLLDHAHKAQVAEGLVRSTVNGIEGYRNPVIRLQASHAILTSDDQLRAARRDAIEALRSYGWTWEAIGSVIGTGKQRAWQIGNGL